MRDVNDNPPVFHNRPYIVNISEALPVGSEIEVRIFVIGIFIIIRLSLGDL